MRYQMSALMAAGLSFCTVAAADVARHSTVTTDMNGKVTEFAEMVADETGNLRVEIYDADSDGNQADLRNLIVYQATENRMLTMTGGKCRSVDLAGDSLPGGVSKDDVQAAQARMQKMLEEMRTKNPEMAKMLEKQMGGMAPATNGDKPAVELTRTGATKKIDGYDTVELLISGMPGASDGYRVWAAEADDVDGADIMSAASAKMMQAHKQRMERMGMGELVGGTGFTEIIEEMTDYYPVMTDDGRRQTRLVSTDGNGTEDFHPACNP